MEINSDMESIIFIDLDPDSEDNHQGNISDNSSTDDVPVNDFINDLELVENLSEPGTDEEPETASDSREFANDNVDNGHVDDKNYDDENYDICVDLDHLGNDTRSFDEMYDYFQLYFSDDLFESICNNTNKYQKSHVEQKRITTPDYAECFWYDTNLLEMKAYFWLAIIFGILYQRDYLSYWSKDPFLGNQGVPRVFSLKRYSKLSEYVHVSDRVSEKNRGHPDYEKLGKVCWLYDHLQGKFRQYKHPEKAQTIDEMIMPFSGRILYIQYNVS